MATHKSRGKAPTKAKASAKAKSKPSKKKVNKSRALVFKGSSATVPRASMGNTGVSKGRPPIGVRFAAAPNLGGRDGLRLMATVPYLNLTVDANTAVNSGALQISSGSIVSNVVLDPNISGQWINTAIPLMAGCFSRYKFKSVTFHYRNIAGITVDRAPFAVGWVDDPYHPALTNPTFAKIESLQHNVLFNSWEDWDMPVRIDDSILHYSVADSNTVAGFRLSFTGNILGIQGFSSTPSLNYGVIYASVVVDLYDFSPIYSSVSLAARPVAPFPALMSVAEEKTGSSDGDPDFHVVGSSCSPVAPLGARAPLNARRF